MLSLLQKKNLMRNKRKSKKISKMIYPKNMLFRNAQKFHQTFRLLAPKKSLLDSFYQEMILLII